MYPISSEVTAFKTIAGNTKFRWCISLDGKPAMRGVEDNQLAANYAIGQRWPGLESVWLARHYSFVDAK